MRRILSLALALLIAAALPGELPAVAYGSSLHPEAGGDNLCLPLPAERTVVARCGEGYLEEDSQGNLILHLKGSPYEMGYQHGVLCKEGVEKMTHEYPEQLFPSLLGLNTTSPRLLSLWPFFRKLGVNRCLAMEKYIPEEYREEMRGIADGAGENVTYEDVLLLNEGIDATSSMLYPLLLTYGEVVSIPFTFRNLVYLQRNPAAAGAASSFPLPACNEFVVFGNGTEDGRLLHGRDLMWNLAGMAQDYMLVRVAEPDEGYPFISTILPGFVGTLDGMNSQGITCAANLVLSRDCLPLKGRMGMPFIVRDVVQHSATLDEGIERIRNAPRSVSWIYVISDAKIPDGAVVETSAHLVRVRAPEEEYRGQVEQEPCLVAATNHFIHPTMKLTERGFSYYGRAYGGGLNSEWRYDHLCAELLQSYGEINATGAREIIDFLHPPNYEHLAFKFRNPWYTANASQAVYGAISLFDSSRLEMWALYGYYDRPWVHYNLTEELARDGEGD